MIRATPPMKIKTSCQLARPPLSPLFVEEFDVVAVCVGSWACGSGLNGDCASAATGGARTHSRTAMTSDRRSTARDGSAPAVLPTESLNGRCLLGGWSVGGAQRRRLLRAGAGCVRRGKGWAGAPGVGPLALA